MTPIYAIGDIHGHLAKLEEQMAWISSDGGVDAQVVFLGDFTDRGPDSKGVLDYLIKGQADGLPWHFIKGNHDRMFEWFLETPSRRDPILNPKLDWLHPRLGGDTTLASYGIEDAFTRPWSEIYELAKESVPQEHVGFLAETQTSYETPDLYFVHAGIDPNVPLSKQAEDDQLWIRQPFHDVTTPHPKLIVHGHSPVEFVTDYGNRVNVDTGAGKGFDLSTVVFEGLDRWLLTEHGRIPLYPA